MQKVLSEKITSWVIQTNEGFKDNKQVIEYGLNLIIDNTVRFLMLLIVALAIGRLKEFLIVVATFSLLRSQAGGWHMKTAYGCTASVIAVVILCSILSVQIPFYSQSFLIILAIVLYLLHRYAPCDTSNNPLEGSEIRRKKKIRSYLVVLGMTLIVFFITDIYCKSLIQWALLAESLTIIRKKR